MYQNMHGYNGEEFMIRGDSVHLVAPGVIYGVLDRVL